MNFTRGSFISAVAISFFRYLGDRITGVSLHLPCKFWSSMLVVATETGYRFLGFLPPSRIPAPLSLLNTNACATCFCSLYLPRPRPPHRTSINLSLIFPAVSDPPGNILSVREFSLMKSRGREIDAGSRRLPRKALDMAL